MSGIGFLGRSISRTLLYRRTVSGHHLAALSTVAPDAKPGNEQVVKPFEEIPGPTGLYKLPFIGTLLHFKPFTKITAQTVHLLLDEMFEKYGPVVKMELGTERVLISDPKDIETVFRNEGRYPLRLTVDIGIIYAKRNNIKNSLIDLQDEEWSTLRTPLNKRLMKVDSASFYLELQNAIADSFVQRLAVEKLEPEKLAEFFFRYASESIGVVCFNTRLGFLDIHSQNSESEEFLQVSRDVFTYFNQAITGESIAHIWFKNKTYLGYERCRNVLRVHTLRHILKAKEVLEARKKEGTLQPDEPNLLLSLLSDSSISDEDILNMMETLYVAGTDSTAKNLQTMFYNLAMNPDKQEKLREEVLRVMGPDGPMLAESLAKMPYLKACLKESFRLIYPTVTGPQRVLPTDVVLSGYRVPAGVRIVMHNPKTSRDYVTHPDKFIPERWLRQSDGKRTENIPQTATLPFGYGPRNCVGRRFAEQEIYLATAKVLQKLQINVEPESRGTNFIYTLFVHPEKPIRFTFSKLNA